MRKIIVYSIVLLAAMVSGMAVKAQDTVHQGNMRLMENYFVPKWLDSFMFDDYYKVYTVNLGYIVEDYQNKTERAYRAYTDDTLTVYGLVGSFSTPYRINPEYYERHPTTNDTSCTHSRIYMRLYEAEPYNHPRFIGEELLVHLNETPVSYWLDLGVARSQTPWNPVPPLPMYERYFTNPVNVVDSFYFGVRYRNIYTGGAPVIKLSVANVPNPHVSFAYYDKYYQRWMYATTGWFIPLLFPIIAPPDTTQMDTTQVVDTTGGTGTAGIGDDAFVYRYTAVQPNPASHKVRVTSSFGLGKIEAYDEKGRLAFSTDASGMATTIDVSSWKKGFYLLRITTGSGTTTKKLLVE